MSTTRGCTLTTRHSMGVGELDLYKPYYFRVIALGKPTEDKPSDVLSGRAAKAHRASHP